MARARPEVLIVGAGIAGASAARFLAPHAKVTVLEREDQPGYIEDVRRLWIGCGVKSAGMAH